MMSEGFPVKLFNLREVLIEYVWNHFGGSIWEISTLLGRFLKVCRNGKVEDREMKKNIERYLLQSKCYFEEILD